MAVKLKNGQTFLHSETGAQYSDIYAVIRSIVIDRQYGQVRINYATYATKSARDAWKQPLVAREFVLTGNDYKADITMAECYTHVMAQLDGTKYQSDEGS